MAICKCFHAHISYGHCMIVISCLDIFELDITKKPNTQLVIHINLGISIILFYIYSCLVACCYGYIIIIYQQYIVSENNNDYIPYQYIYTNHVYR